MKGSVTLYSSVTEERDEGDGFTRVRISGAKHAAAIVNAVAGNWNRILERARPTAKELQGRIGEKVTLVMSGANVLGAGHLDAMPGTLFAGSLGVGILPKGSRRNGYSVDAARVVDVLPGYDTDEATRLAAEVRGRFPTLVELTQEHLAALPRSSKTCSLAIFGTHPLFGSVDALWLAGEYWPDDDILDTSVCIIRPEHGTSEHGSNYGRDLLRMDVGVVEGFTPISFKEAVDLTDLDYDEAIAAALRTAVPA